MPGLSLWAELRRRKVIRATLTYLVVAWLVLQVAAILLPSFEVPAWGMRLVILMCALGLPLVVVLAWAFDLTPEGMKRTSASASADPEVDPAQSRWRKRSAFALGLALLTGGLLILVAFILLGRSKPSSEGPGDRSIAIMPFASISADSDNAYFAAGVHEDILTQLARIKELEVASRSSVLRYRDQPGDLRSIAERLGVHYIVEGSVRRDGDMVRISVQLIDARRDRNLWAEQYDRRLENIFALQSEISRQIAGQLRARITPAEAVLLDAVPTTNLAAYEAFLRARGTLTGFWVGFDVLQKAEEELDFATRADPAFVEAWALLSVVHSRRTMQFRGIDTKHPQIEASSQRARAALDMALRLNPDNLASLRARGYYHIMVTNDFLEASRSLDRAIALVPNDAETMATLGYGYRRLGQMEKAIDVLRRAVELDPGQDTAFNFLSRCLHDTGRFAELVPLYKQALARNPERLHYALEAKFYRFLSTGTLAAYEEYEDALEKLEITDGCDPSSWREGRMTAAMLHDEFDVYASNWHEQWEAHHQGHGAWVCPLQVNEEANHAALLIARGETEKAAEILRTSLENITLPSNPLAVCTFDTAVIRPKLYQMSGDSAAAKEDLRQAMLKVAGKSDDYLKYVEKAVLLEAADLILPEEVYAFYQDIADDPVRLVSLELVCAHPWTYPNLLASPQFQRDVREDGRFVAFLGKFGFLKPAVAMLGDKSG